MQDNEQAEIRREIQSIEEVRRLLAQLLEGKSGFPPRFRWCDAVLRHDVTELALVTTAWAGWPRECVMTGGTRFWWPSRTWFLRANDEPAGFSSRPPPPIALPPYVITSKTAPFFKCVAGSILMTWCEWLGGNVTSGI